MKILKKVFTKEVDGTSKMSKSKLFGFLLVLLTFYNFLARPVLSGFLLSKSILTEELPIIDLGILNLLNL